MIVRHLAAHVAALGQKPLVISDDKRRAVAFAVAPGQSHQVPLASSRNCLRHQGGSSAIASFPPTLCAS